MKIFFVVSDVHSFYKEMINALNDAGFDIANPNHIFVSCGDLLDRGPDPQKCLDFVNNLNSDRKILIRGNHEDLLLEALYRKYFQNHDYHNKTNETVYKLTNIKPSNPYNNFEIDRTALYELENNLSWNNYINTCIDYYETNKYIFVHGYIPVQNDGNNIYYDPNWRDKFADWEQARWLNGMSMWKMGVKISGKTIVCGHWHSSYGHARFHGICREFDKDENGILKSVHTPFYEDGLIAMDSCVAYSGFINCLKIEVEDE